MRTALLLSAVVLACLAAFPAPVTTESLLREMTDLERLTRFPDPAYKTIQFSSYDRRSAVPGGPDWFANSDGFGGEPVPNFEAVLTPPKGREPGEYLVCDVKGPGALVRVWTAQIKGDLRVWLDGAKTPLYDGPAEAFLLRPYDTFLEGSGLDAKDLDGTLYQQNAAYAPIPFAKGCRMVWSGNHRDIHFYQIQFRMYDRKAKVKSFSPDDLKANAPLLRETMARLADPDVAADTAAARPIQVSLAPKASATALELAGPGAVQRLTLKVTAPDLDRALRQTVLHVLCDGEPWGQVQAPVGDFFGAGPGVNPYNSSPFTVKPDGTMTCRYVMPYKSGIKILLENLGDQEVSVTGEAVAVDHAWDDNASMHFRARWRADHGLTASNGDSMGVQDMPYVLARGRGVYVGTALMLLNPNNVPTPWGNWWGEGDEKIFVDDDVRPSTFGTGSEDYFNYAWSDPALFGFPYCGQPRNDGPANRGFVVNQRWHILDPLPFAESLAFYMELFSHERTEGVSYGRIGYYYARPGTLDDHVPLTDTDLQLPELPATWEPAPRFGAQKWESSPCEALAAPDAPVELLAGPLWQGGQVMVWTPTENGQTLTLTFHTAEAVKHSLNIACMLQPGAGAFRAAVNGEAVKFDGKETLSLDIPHGVQSRVFGAGQRELAAGAHELVLTAVEAGKPIGLDFLAVRPH
ncbi:MAG: DUF2961 domain-containing protein [Candidatus Hydrogenedentes bacterium]|nr:DUF2961 domain-containing protein [Candidatus Hydrogenedentota bacterium]